LAHGEVAASVRGELPATSAVEAPFACQPTAALFTWLNSGGSVSQLACSPEGCVPTTVEQPDIPAERVVSLGQAGDNLIVVWRNERDEPLVRMGRLAEFAHSATAPLWKGGARPASWELVSAIQTGRSLLLVVKHRGLLALQIHSDGKLEALGPRAQTPSE
jgi:hypothetical protein